MREGLNWPRSHRRSPLHPCSKSGKPQTGRRALWREDRHVRAERLLGFLNIFDEQKFESGHSLIRETITGRAAGICNALFVHISLNNPTSKRSNKSAYAIFTSWHSGMCPEALQWLTQWISFHVFNLSLLGPTMQFQLIYTPNASRCKTHMQFY